MKLFKCSVCNYVYEGEEPRVCPRCGAAADKSVPLEGEAAKKMETAQKTNDLFVDVIRAANKLISAGEAGIQENLDPSCLNTFGKIKDMAWAIKQMAKAEMEGHVSRGKW